jgi:ubiquinone/menaquinone biosynthesis C-methylase UbiE
LEAAEFDKFADEYLAIHNDNLRVSGERPEYFARYKVDEIARRWLSWGQSPRTVLDFGSGIGASLPHLARAFPAAELTALDVSARSLAISAKRFEGSVRSVHYSGIGPMPLPAKYFDLVFTSCVFHHIEAAAHVNLLKEVRRLLCPGARLAG